jgi:CIC family chloride channel protein
MPEVRESHGGLGGFIRRSGYLRKWLILGISIGVIAGLGAVVFYLALDYAGRFLLGYLAGYDIPKPVGDGGDAGSPGFDRPWAIPLVVCGGALVSAWLVARFAPEAEGHGTDSAIEAVHTDPRAIRTRAIVVKTITSAVTIGSGGSGGREGPAAQISAGFGSLLTRRLNLTDEDGRIAVSLGIGSGIGAIFGAPLGGAVLAASIVYREDFDYRSLIPGFITSGTAYAIYGAILGFEPLFGFIAPDYRFQPWQLIWFLVIGIISAAIGYLYARTFYATVALTNRLPGGSVLKPAVGGLLVGLLALVIPQILSSGYGWAQKAAATDTLMTIPLWIVLVLPIAKIVATSLSIGTGGSGGIFGPGIVIGAFVGAAIWRLADLAGAPGIPHGPGVFVVAGMMACFGSVAHAPLAVMIMVAEMTGSFSVVPGAIVAVGIAYLVISSTDVSIYRAQRRNREAAEAERRRAANTEARPTPRLTSCSERARSDLQNVDFGAGGNLLTGGYRPIATTSWTSDRRPWRRAVVVAIGLAAAAYLLVRCARGHLLLS